MTRVMQIFGNSTLIAAFGMVRNLIIARIIGPESFGIASSLIITIAFVEMASTLGLQKFLIQHRHGSRKDYQATLQAIHFARGLIAATAIIVLAEPIANYFNSPDLVGTYRLLAIIPIILGLEHFDIHRFTRNKLYVSALLHSSIPLLVSIFAVLLSTHWFIDHNLMLVGIISQWTTATILSHLLSKRSYRWNLRSSIARSVLAFGWPIFAINIVLFFNMEGEKLIVGQLFGFAELGILTMGLMIAGAPIKILTRSMSLLYFPRLSRARGDLASYQSLVESINRVTGILALSLASAFIVFGPLIVDLVLGKDYQELSQLLFWLAVWQSIVLLKYGMSEIAIAGGYTKIPLLAAFVRLAFLPVIFYIGDAASGLIYIAWSAILAESCSFAVLVILVNRQLNLPTSLFGTAKKFALGVAFSIIVAIGLHPEFTVSPLRFVFICTILLPIPSIWIELKGISRR